MSFEKLYVINRCYAGKMYRLCIINTVVVAHQLVILVGLQWPESGLSLVCLSFGVTIVCCMQANTFLYYLNGTLNKSEMHAHFFPGNPEENVLF